MELLTFPNDTRRKVLEILKKERLPRTGKRSSARRLAKTYKIGRRLEENIQGLSTTLPALALESGLRLEKLEALASLPVLQDRVVGVLSSSEMLLGNWIPKKHIRRSTCETFSKLAKVSHEIGIPYNLRFDDCCKDWPHEGQRQFDVWLKSRDPVGICRLGSKVKRVRIPTYNSLFGNVYSFLWMVAEGRFQRFESIPIVIPFPSGMNYLVYKYGYVRSVPCESLESNSCALHLYNAKTDSYDRAIF